MRKRTQRGQTGREMRRAAWRAEVHFLVKTNPGVTRRLVSYLLQHNGASWRTFGMAGEAGGPEFGPPAPPEPWAKDGIPKGQRCVDGVWVTL